MSFGRAAPRRALEGRRTGAAFFDGDIAERARDRGAAAPRHAALATLIRRTEAHPSSDPLPAF